MAFVIGNANKNVVVVVVRDKGFNRSDRRCVEIEVGKKYHTPLFA